MALFNLENLKEKAKATAGNIADASVELYKKAEEKSRIAARAAKLSAEITRDKGAVRRLYYELGKNYYELHEVVEEALAPYCDEIRSTLKRIAEKQAEIDDLKGDAGASDDGVDVEIVPEELVEEIAEDEECEEADCGCGCCEEAEAPAEEPAEEE